MLAKIPSILARLVPTISNSLPLISASKRPLSDALFVHRENDQDVKSFEFDATNKVVKFILLPVDSFSER